MLITLVVKLSNYLQAVISHSGLGGERILCLCGRGFNPRPQNSPILSAYGLWKREAEPGLSTHCASLLFLCSPPDLRVFPERYVVCVSRPEDASAHHGNLSLATVSAVYTPPFPLPVTWQNVSRGSVCYYRDAFAKLPSHFMCPNLFFAGGRGSSEPTGAVWWWWWWGSWVASVEALKLQSHPLP